MKTIDERPTAVEHDGFTVVQYANNDIQVYRNGRIIIHSSCKTKKTIEELKEYTKLVKTFMREDRG